MKKINSDIINSHKNFNEISTTHIYINGISTKYLFDEYGQILKNDYDEPIPAKVLNFESFLTRADESLNKNYLVIKWDKGEVFDYKGLAVICDEVVFIEDSDRINVNENELRIKIRRGIHGTNFENVRYPENTIIRSVVYITYDSTSFEFESKSDVVSNNLFAPVIDTSRIKIYQDVINWANYNENNIFAIRRKLAVYIFNGNRKSNVCSYIGFIDSFELNSYDSSIDLICKDKMSTVWNEKITAHKTYSNISLKEFLSDFLNIPINMIIYPLHANSGVMYDDKIKMNTWVGSIYNDSYFFNIDVLSTKDFDTYSDLLTSLCKEMCCRIKYDTNERLVIQSDVLLVNNSEELYDKNLTHVYTSIDADNDIVNITQTTNNQIIINKIEGEFIERETFYDNNDFLLNHIIFDVYYSKDKTDENQRVFEEHYIYNIDGERNSDSPYIMIDENKKTIQVVVILSDSNYNNKTTWYRWCVVPSQRYDEKFGQIKSVSWDWVFKDFTTKFIDESKYKFTEAVKYSRNKKIKNAKFLKYDANKSPEFTTLKTYNGIDENGKEIFSSEILIGENIKYVDIGDYVMFTDGKMDFMGTISDKKYGITTITTPGDITYKTNESINKKQYFSITNKNMDEVSGIYLSNGKEIIDYKFDKITNTVTGYVEDDEPFYTYTNPSSITKIYKYEDNIPKTITTTEHFSTPYPGDYSGQIQISKNENTFGAWNRYGEETVYLKNTTNKLNIGSVISNDGIKDSYEYRTIVTRVVEGASTYYTKYWNIYTIQERRTVNKTVTYSGNISLNTYKYTVNIYINKINYEEDIDKINESTITITTGYDRGYQHNYWGRHEYLEKNGYLSDSPMDLQLFYVRNEFPYVYEYSRDDTTSTMEYPMLPGETISFEGDFGGINVENKKFAKIVDRVQDIYGKHFSNINQDGSIENNLPNELLYNREYHVPIYLYTRFNDINQKIINQGEDNETERLNYLTFDNRGICVDIKTQVERVSEIKDFLNIDNLTSVESSNKDISVDITNMMVSDNYYIKTEYDATAYYLNEENEKIIINIETGTRLKCTSWNRNDFYLYDPYREYKIINPNDTSDDNFYFISKAVCKADFDKIEPILVYGKKAIKVNSSNNFKIGDVIILDKINEDNIDTQTIYSKYNNARWLVTNIDRNVDGENVDIIYLDYEFPMGENNKIPTINKFDYKFIKMFQEFGIKGNPYVEIIHNIRYENATSIDIYGEKKYDGITGKFISTNDLNTVISYIINGFAGTSFDNTKFVVPISMFENYNLELFDIVRITEDYYTGLKEQIAIITGIKQSYNGSETSTTYTLFTLGKYDIDSNVSIKDSSNYEPIELPVYNEDGNTSGKVNNFTNVTVNKYDDELGNIMLLQIASDNLCAKTKKEITSDDNIITLYKVSSGYDNTPNLKTKKYYSDILLDKNQELFVKIGSEYMYCKVVDCIKGNQSYTDSDGNTVNVSGIVSESILQIKKRGVFDTNISNAAADSNIELYQITSMVNSDGSYSTSILIGDKYHREYFEFTIDDGIDITTSRGKLLINTNEDWYLQAKSILYKYYDENLVNSLTESEVLDYLGKGVVQIGLSSTLKINEWKPNTNYHENDYINYKNIIYQCLSDHLSENIFDDSYWKYKYTDIEYGQFLRYSPVGGLELKGNVDIDSGSFKINDLKNDNNFIHFNDKQGIIGVGVGTSFFVENENKNINSFVQIGDYLNNDGLLYYNTIDGISELGIKTKNLSIILNREDYSTYASLLFDKDNQIISLNTDGKSKYSKFQIGKYTGTNISYEDNHFYYENNYDKSIISIKIDKGYIGNNNSNIVFDNPESPYVQDSWIFDTEEEKNNYFGIYDSVSKEVIGGTLIGNSEMLNIVEEAYRNSKIYIKVSNNYQYYDINNFSWKIYSPISLSNLYFNNGMQQIGNNVKDTLNVNGYSGFYFGTVNSSNIGDIAQGKYLKFDGKRFDIGENVTLNCGGKIVNVEDLIDGTLNNNLEGTTVFTDNLITIYPNENKKYTQLYYNTQPVIIYGNYDSNLITINNIIPTIQSISYLPELENGLLIKLIGINSGDIIEGKITYILGDKTGFNINKIINSNEGYYLYYETKINALVHIGDLTDAVTTNSLIKIGYGIDYDENLDEYAVGIHLKDFTNKNYFNFDSKNGLSLNTINGVISIENSNAEKIYNKLFFDKYNNSYLYMNNGQSQIGILQNLKNDSISKYNNKEGLFVGDNVNADSYLLYSENDGLIVRGNFILDNGNNVKDEISNSENNINDRIDQELNNIQSLTIYDNKVPSGLLWKNENTYKIYDTYNEIWKEIDVVRTKNDISKIFLDSDNKYYKYNNYLKVWRQIYLFENNVEPNIIAKDDTIWIDTNYNCSYRYNQYYNFSYTNNEEFNGIKKLIISLELENVGISYYNLNIKYNCLYNSKIYLNDLLLGDILSNTNIANYKIPIEKLLNGKNIIKIISENIDNNITISNININSIGIVKWETNSNPQEIIINNENNEKSRIFILTKIPDYKNKIDLTGNISINSNNLNKIIGTGTKFKEELNIGDIIFVSDIYYVVDKIESNEILYIIEKAIPIENIKIKKVIETWENFGNEVIYSELYDSTIKVGQVIIAGEQIKNNNNIYWKRGVVSSIKDNYIYVKYQITKRRYPYDFNINDIRDEYDNDEKIYISPRDTIYVLNYYELSESAIFSYIPNDKNLNKRISIMDTRLNNLRVNTDFIINSSLNNRNIFIETEYSKLLFSGDINIYDEISISKNGKYGRFQVGSSELQNYFKYDSEFGMSLSTSKDINIVGNGLLYVSGGNISIESNSTMKITSNSLLSIDGSSVSISSNSDFIVKSENVLFDQESSINIKSKYFSLDVTDMLFKSNGGTVLINNNMNEIYFSKTDNSRIILNSNPSEVSNDTIFKLGENFSYDKYGTLKLINAELRLTSNDNDLTISPDKILSRKIDTESSLEDYDFDDKFIMNSYYANRNSLSLCASYDSTKFKFLRTNIKTNFTKTIKNNDIIEVPENCYLIIAECPTDINNEILIKINNIDKNIYLIKAFKNNVEVLDLNINVYMYIK